MNEEETIENLKEMLKMPDGVVIATFIDEVEAVVDYEAREVEEVNYSEPDTRKWLVKYWKDKYGIDVPDFEYEIGILFLSVSMHTGDVIRNTYSYPSSLFKGFEFVSDEETEEEEGTDERWGWL